jgi:hypothetical protein
MAITKNFNRQELLVAHVDIKLADLTSGVAAAAIDLPPNAVVTGGEVVTAEAFNSAASDVLDVGDAGSASRYLNDGNVHAAGRVALVPTGFSGSGNPVTVTWTSGGGTPTAGKLRLALQYYIAGRATSTLG